MNKNPWTELVIYLNISTSQVEELVRLGKVEMAIEFLGNMKKAIAEIAPEALQHNEVDIVSELGE